MGDMVPSATKFRCLLFVTPVATSTVHHWCAIHSCQLSFNYGTTTTVE